MECFTVYVDEIEGRLDSLYLKNRTIIENPKTKYKLVELGKLLKTKVQYGANETAIDSDYKKDVRYIRITDIDEFGNLKNDDWKTAAKIEKKYMLKEGDVLFARSGATAGKCFLYKNEYGKSIFAGYLIRFIFEGEKINPKYVFYYTQLQRYRHWVSSIQRPSGQPNINSEEFKSFTIPLPPSKIQNQIINIMDNAYKVKKSKVQEAQQLLESINDYVLSELGTKLPSDEKKMCFSIYSNEIEGRIDQRSYHTIRMNAIKAIKSSKNEICPLKNIVSFKREIITSNNQNLPYIGLENIESNTGSFMAPKEIKKSFGSAFKFNKGDILFPKLRPYLNKVHLAEFDGVCSTEFHVMESKKCNNLYLSAFLRSKLIVNQTSYLMTGNTLPRLQTIHVENLLIPIPSEGVQNKIAEEVKRRIQKSQRLQEEGKQTLEDVKVKVECIILGDEYL